MTTEPRPPLTKRLGPGHWRFLDGLVGVGYSAILLGWLARESVGPRFAVTVVPALVLGAAIVWRRRYPVVALVATLAVLLVLQWPYPSLLPMWCALCCVAASGRRWIVILAVTGAVVAPAVVVATLDRAILLGLVSSLIATVGYAVGRHRAYELELRRHHVRQTEIEREAARHGIAEERMRIARELHDVVAHSMSVITVQAGYGHLVIDRKPAEARAALGAIEVTGRQALTEMRRLLGVLRDDSHDPATLLTPVPKLADLDQLIAQTTQAGVRVELDITGRTRPLPSGIELSAYRIVQEALTNVLRHAHAPTSRVSIGYGDDDLSIVVSDQGVGTAGDASHGHGLIGMRERVHLYGGEFHAGSQPGRGFQVSARIPLPGGHE